MTGGMALETSPSSSGAPMTPLSRRVKLSLASMFIMTFLDMIGYMAISPSLIFYVRELGGTERQYGLIMASANFVAFFMMPLYASWVDASGNKYRTPLFCGTSLSICGMILYSIAVLFSGSSLGVWVLLLSRIVYGIGASSASIFFSYITSVFEHDQLSFATTTLSIASFGGLAVGPFVNTLLAEVDTTWLIPGTSLVLPLNSSNAVGLLMAANDALGLVAIYFFVPEPPKEKIARESSTAAAAAAATQGDDSSNAGWGRVAAEITSFPLFLPCLTIFALNANYQLIESSFAPAASHGLNWGPVQTSAVLGSSSILLMICTCISMVLTTHFKVPDASLIIGGFSAWFLSGSMIYAYWTFPAEAWEYVVPILIGLVGFPFIGPAARSRFSIAIQSRPELEPIQARLQAVIAMFQEVANFTTPLLVGAFILRSPLEVEEGTNHHELTPFALYIPILSGICIIGWVYSTLVANPEDASVDEDEIGDLVKPATESTQLVPKTGHRRSSIASINSEFSFQNEASRLRTSSIIGGNTGIPLVLPFDTDDEKHRREKLWEQKKHWEEMMTEALNDDLKA